MIFLGPLSLLGFMLLGTVLLMTSSFLHNNPRARSRSFISNLLTLVGWIAIILGSVGFIFGATLWFSVPIQLVLVATLWKGFLEHRRSERHLLVWSLTAAAERNIPLQNAAFAFAADGESKVHRQARRLAEELNRGVPLSAAINRTCPQLSDDTMLAVRLGEPLGQLASSLRRSLQTRSDTTSQVRNLVEKGIYLLGIIFVMAIITTFVIVKIVPVFEKMFAEHGHLLPLPTQNLIQVSKWFTDVAYFIVPVFPLLLLASVCYYLGLFPRDVPLLNWLYWPEDRVRVLQTLSWGIQAHSSLPRTLSLAAERFPRSLIRRKLTSVTAQIDSGTDWLDALQQAGFVTRGETALLRAAAQANNLPWMLEEIATAKQRRIAYQLRWLYSILFPVFVLTLGAITAFIVVALFCPLIDLISRLS